MSKINENWNYEILRKRIPTRDYFFTEKLIQKTDHGPLRGPVWKMSSKQKQKSERLINKSNLRNKIGQNILGE